MSKSEQEFVAATEGHSFTTYTVMKLIGIPLSEEQEEFQAYLERTYPAVVEIEELGYTRQNRHTESCKKHKAIFGSVGCTCEPVSDEKLREEVAEIIRPLLHSDWYPQDAHDEVTLRVSSQICSLFQSAKAEAVKAEREEK